MFDAMKFLQKIDYIRLGGSDEELKAAKFIAEEMEKIGLKSSIEEFEITAFEPSTAAIEVIEPYKARYEGYPIGYSGQYDDIVELHPMPMDVEDVSQEYSGKCIMSSKRAHYNSFENLIKSEISALIMVNPPMRKPTYTCYSIEAIEKFGRIPGISLSYEDCADMIEKKASKIRIIIDDKSRKAPSRNVIGELPCEGPDCIVDEEIIICGHYDSVATSPGMIDNAAGVATVLMMAEKMIAKKPRRKMRFIAFGSEELGLRGSKAFVMQHKDELDKIRFIVNIDIAGDILGHNFSRITGPDEIRNYMDAWKKIKGYSIRNTQDIYSSDNMPFCKMGIPAVSFGRGGVSGNFVHWSGDTIEHIDIDALNDTAKIIEDFLWAISSSNIFPFERAIPVNIKKKVKDYFGKRWNVEVD